MTVIQGPWCPVFGYAPTVGLGLNELGSVVGYYLPCTIGDDEAYFWIRERGLVTIAFGADAIRQQAYDINDRGMIVGRYDRANDSVGDMGFFYDAGALLDIPTLPGGNWAQAAAINNQGQVVGSWGNDVTGNPAVSAFVWETKTAIDLGPVLRTPRSAAHDISNKSMVTGWMGSARLDDGRAFTIDLRRATITDLGPIQGGTTSEGRAINDCGEVAGLGIVPDPEWPGPVWHPFLWRDGQMLDLGTLPGYRRCLATDLNDRGEVVGYCDVGGTTAFVWHNDVMENLNDLIVAGADVYLGSASAINDAGQILGTGVTPTGTVAVVLTPIRRRHGDLDGDCRIGITDLLELLSQWGPCRACSCAPDLDGDGTVAHSDLVMLLNNWG